MVTTTPAVSHEPGNERQPGTPVDGSGTSGASDTGNAAGEPRDRPTRPQGPTYSLIRPPSYDTIVGGVPPSPFASIILLLGFGLLIVAATGTAIGNDMTEWWLLGAMMLAIAVFLAGFVSRGK